MPRDAVDYLVIGAGPAGLQLAVLLHAAGRDYLVVEAGEAAGTFFTRFPRHRTLISNNKRYTGSDDPEFNLRMDWNSLLLDDPRLRFTQYSARYFPPAEEMVRYLRDVADRLGLNVRYRTRIASIAREGAAFSVTDTAGNTITARRVVIATGVSRQYVPPIPGVELAELYSEVSVDPQDFVNQRVLILGKGNSAFETADNLVETAAVIHVAGPNSVRLAWKTHYVGHLRAVNNNFLDTYQLKSQNAILDGSVRSIERVDGRYRVQFAFVRADEIVKELWYDRVILATGFQLDTSIFQASARPRLVHHDRFAELSPVYESVNVPDLWFAGTLTQQRDFKRSTSGFIHGFRYGARALFHALQERYEGVPWPARTVPAEPAALADAVVARVNRSSGLWQQFGVLGDLLIVDPDGARYLEEVPVEHAPVIGGADHFVVTLEYGPHHDQVDPFDITVARIAQDAAGQAHDAAYLHPVLRHWRNGQVVAVHHMAENLENEWNRPQAHLEPLRAFFQAQTGSLATAGA